MRKARRRTIRERKRLSKSSKGGRKMGGSNIFNFSPFSDMLRQSPKASITTNPTTMKIKIGDNMGDLLPNLERKKNEVSKFLYEVIDKKGIFTIEAIGCNTDWIFVQNSEGESFITTSDKLVAVKANPNPAPEKMRTVYQ
jgi:hypothetical protein